MLHTGITGKIHWLVDVPIRRHTFFRKPLRDQDSHCCGKVMKKFLKNYTSHGKSLIQSRLPVFQKVKRRLGSYRDCCAIIDPSDFFGSWNVHVKVMKYSWISHEIWFLLMCRNLIGYCSGQTHAYLSIEARCTRLSHGIEQMFQQSTYSQMQFDGCCIKIEVLQVIVMCLNVSDFSQRIVETIHKHLSEMDDIQ